MAKKRSTITVKVKVDRNDLEQMIEQWKKGTAPSVDAVAEKAFRLGMQQLQGG